MRFKNGSAIGFLLIAACAPTAPKQVRVTPPPAPIVIPHTDPIPAPIGTALQLNPKIDPVGLIIVEARMRVENGEDLYSNGFLKRAKDEFDGALDLLLDSAGLYPNNPRLDQEINSLVSRVHSLELTAFKNGDGFTDQSQEHAAIDDLDHITTFPSPIDPKFKREVEADVAEIPHDLPIEINDRVLNFLEYYQNGRGRGFIETGLERIGKYQPMIEDVLKNEGVPQDLIYLCEAESAFIPRAVSRASAKGMWQFISSRGKEYGLRQNWWIDERSDPEKSTRAAARHLKDLYQEFGDWYLAMAAYNAGPMRIQRAMDKTGETDFWKLVERKALPKETMNYVPTILALSIIGKNPEKYGFSVASTQPLETDRINVSKATDLRVIAETIHVSVDDLRDLNPHVLRWTTPPDDSEFQLNVPKGLGDQVQAQIAALPVQRGETLSTVAKKYGTSVTELAQANNVSSKKPLHMGQEIMIPMSGVGPAETVAAKTASASRTVTYTARRGDTLSKIAAKYHISSDELKEWNHLSSSHVTAGKRLIVSAPKAAAKTAPVKTASTAAKKPVVRKVAQARP